MYFQCHYNFKNYVTKPLFWKITVWARYKDTFQGSTIIISEQMKNLSLLYQIFFV